MLQLHRVFDNLEVTRNFTGQVLLLEEDYYVAPDIITTLQMMQTLKKKSVPLYISSLFLITVLLEEDRRCKIGLH